MVKYLIPTSVNEVLDYINNFDTKIISGATDLMVQKRNWAELPAMFEKNPVYIFNLRALKYIKKIDNELRIGACTPLSDILAHKDTPELLKESIRIIASPALRNLATIPGNIVNASPAGDTLPVLYVLDASAVIKSIDSERKELVRDIITGPRRTILKSNELITEIRIPLETFSTIQFVKVGGRKADAISKISFTGAVKIENNVVNDIRIAYGAVGPTVIRNIEIEKTYQSITLDVLRHKKDEIINRYSALVKPIDDQRSTKEYRKTVALNLLEDFLNTIE